MEEFENTLLKIEREKIDKIDEKITKLLDKRLDIVGNIFKIKQKNGLPIFQPLREQDKLVRIRKLSSNFIFNEQIFKTIIEESKKFQEELIQ